MDSMGPGWRASGIASGRCAIGDAWSTGSYATYHPAAPRRQAPTSPGIGWAKTVTQGHRPGWRFPQDVGDGSFTARTLWRNVVAVPTHDSIPGYYVFNALMASLIVMHVIWYLMFWRMFFRLLGGETGHEAGKRKEEYEGDSDDD